MKDKIIIVNKIKGLEFDKLEIQELERELEILDTKMISKSYSNQEQRLEINKQRKLLDNKIKRLKLEHIREVNKENLDIVKAHVEKLGGEVLGDSIYTVSAEIEMGQRMDFLQLEIVENVFDYEQEECILHLNKMVDSSGATYFWHLNTPHLDIIGTGFNLGLLDTSVDNRVEGMRNHKVISHTNVDTNNNHGTLVAASTCCNTDTSPIGIPIKGIAYGDKAILVFNFKYMSFVLDGMNWLIDQKEAPDVINMSSGHYKLISSDIQSMYGLNVDIFVEAYKVLFVHSAGNYGNITDSGSSIATLAEDKDDYNGIVVTEMNDYNSRNRSRHKIDSGSSQGPIPTSKRKKPDITAPGTDTYSPGPHPTIEGATIWSNNTGTSFSSPKVAGGVLLLRDLGLSDPRVIKAVLINSADAWDHTKNNGGATVEGSHWDPVYGWGYMNLTRAYDDAFKFILRDIYNLEAQGYSITMAKNDKVTLVWHKNPQGVIGKLSNIKFELYNSAGELEYEDTSTVDNVKQLMALSSGKKIIRVSYNGEVSSHRIAIAANSEMTPAYRLIK